MGLGVKEHRQEGAMAPSFGAHQPYPISSSPSLTGWCMRPWDPIACVLAPAVTAPTPAVLQLSGGPLAPSLPPSLQGRLPSSLRPPAACSGLQGPLHLAPAHRGPGVTETPSLGSWK